MTATEAEKDDVIDEIERTDDTDLPPDSELVDLGDETEAVEEIPAALAGERVDRIVALVTGLSRAEASVLVADGAAVVNGAPLTTKSTRLVEGDELIVRWYPAVSAAPLEADPAVAVTVVYADDDVIVIDKQPGLVVHPGSGNATGTLVQGLLARFPEIRGIGGADRPGIVHRIDKETSGLLVVARSPLGYDSLVEQLGARSVERRYEALVWDHFDVANGRIEAPIGRSTREPTRMTVSERGREAITHYKVIKAYDRPVAVTHVECRLETGRTHQIRVHMLAIGHAVVGDTRYRGARQSLVVPRLFLHAAELGFRQPTTGEELAFAAPLPADLAGVLTALG